MVVEVIMVCWGARDDVTVMVVWVAPLGMELEVVQGVVLRLVVRLILLVIVVVMATVVLHFPW